MCLWHIPLLPQKTGRWDVHLAHSIFLSKGTLMQKFTITLITILLFTFNLSSVTAADKPSTHPQTENKVEPKKIVAKVNGQPIYSDSLNANIKKELRKFKKYGMKNPTPDLMLRQQQKALDKVIRNELIKQESQKLKIADIDKKTEDKFLAIKNKYPDKAVFDRYLKMRKLTVDKMKANLRASVYTDEYFLKQKISDPEIPEEYLIDFYKSNPDDYHRDEAIKVSHILIKVADNATEKETKKAYKKAVKIRKSILKGNDFAETAIEKSECNSASGGGRLKYIKRGYMPKEFEDAAFALEIDKISDVVKTKYGYHIIKVSEKIPEGTVPYEEARGFLKKYFQMDETKKRLNDHVAKLREKAEIEILLPQN
jgi:peptidyl-prolyl cis-trans isomerase C